MHGTFFNRHRPQYMNYGSIGWSIGHELTHGFCNEGSTYDANGNLVDWWKSETKENFLKKLECIVRKYSNYSIEKTGSNVGIISYIINHKVYKFLIIFMSNYPSSMKYILKQRILRTMVV